MANNAKRNTPLYLPPYQMDFGGAYDHYIEDPPFSGIIIYGQVIDYPQTWTGRANIADQHYLHPMLWHRGSYNAHFNNQLDLVPTQGIFYWRESLRGYGKRGFATRAPKMLMIVCHNHGGIQEPVLYPAMLEPLGEIFDEHGIDVVVSQGSPNIGAGRYYDFNGFGDSSIRYKKFFDLSFGGGWYVRDRLVTNPAKFVGGYVYHIASSYDDADYGVLVANEAYGFPRDDWPEVQAHDIEMQARKYSKMAKFGGLHIHYGVRCDRFPTGQPHADAVKEFYGGIYQSMVPQMEGWELIQPGDVLQSVLTGQNVTSPDPTMAATIAALPTRIFDFFEIEP